MNSGAEKERKRMEEDNLILDLFQKTKKNKKKNRWVARETQTSRYALQWFHQVSITGPIPELMKHQVDAARKHTTEHGKGAPIVFVRITRSKLH